MNRDNFLWIDSHRWPNLRLFSFNFEIEAPPTLRQLQRTCKHYGIAGICSVSGFAPGVPC